MKNIVLAVLSVLAINFIDGQTNQANAFGLATTWCSSVPPTYVTGALFPGNGCEHKVVWGDADRVNYHFNGSWNCIAPPGGGTRVYPPPWTVNSGMLWQSSGSFTYNRWISAVCAPTTTILTTQTWQDSSMNVVVEHPYIDGRYIISTYDGSGYNTSNITTSGPCGGGGSASTGDIGQ